MRAVVGRPTQDPSPWLILGRSEWNLKNRDAAAAAFRRAADLDPYNGPALLWLSHIHFAQGQWWLGFRQLIAFWRIIFQTVTQEENALNKSSSE
jgi:tetratricopeptide (TPR) repeat protein